MLRKVLVIIVLLFIGFGLFYFFSSRKKEPKQNIKSLHTRYVKAKPVAYESLEGFINGTGRVASIQQIPLIAAVSGTLEVGDVPIKEGQAFRQSQLLIRLVDDEFLFNHMAKKSRFLQTLASALPDVKIDFSDAYSKWLAFFEGIDINKPLPEIPKIQSSNERVFISSRNILNDFYSLKSEEVRLEKYTIRAPFVGAYSEVFVQQGAYVTQGTRLGIITRTDKYEVEVPIPANEIHMVTIGASVTLNDKATQKTFNGEVKRIARTIDPTTQSVSVYCDIYSNTESALYDGMYYSVAIKGKSIDHVMELSREALYNGESVYVIVDNRLEFKKVNVIKINRESVYFNGLEPNEQVIVEPLMNVSTNAIYEIIP